MTLDDSQLAMDEQNPNGTLTHRTDEDILASGGCNYYATGDVFENGHEWHPRVHSHGEVKCVTCRCKVSETCAHTSETFNHQLVVTVTNCHSYWDPD